MLIFCSYLKGFVEFSNILVMLDDPTPEAPFLNIWIKCTHG